MKSYTDLLAFIEEKDPRIRRAVLPFQGRNVALYFIPSPPPTFFPPPVQSTQDSFE